jgi:hypothetical protein
MRSCASLFFNRYVLVDDLFNGLFNQSTTRRRFESARSSYPSETTYAQCTSSIETHTDDNARNDEQAKDYEHNEKCFHSDLLPREETHQACLRYSCILSVCFILYVHNDFPCDLKNQMYSLLSSEEHMLESHLVHV